MELMSEWSFPGDIYNVSLNNNGNDLIEDVYDWEMQSGRWNKNMIPFYGIGNGDYFCLCSKEGKKSKVYYYYEDKNLFEPYNNSFEECIAIMQRKPTLRQSGDRQLADPGPGGNASGGNMQFAMAGGGTLDAAMAITAENAMVIAALNSMNPDMSNDGIIRRSEGDSETDE